LGTIILNFQLKTLTHFHSNGFDHQARTKATRAHPYATWRAILDGVNPLQIWVPAAFGPVIGMAHIMAHLGFLPANFTHPSH
jgi:hypothetical protein